MAMEEADSGLGVWTSTEGGARTRLFLTDGARDRAVPLKDVTGSDDGDAADAADDGDDGDDGDDDAENGHNEADVMLMLRVIVRRLL